MDGCRLGCAWHCIHAPKCIQLWWLYGHLSLRHFSLIHIKEKPNLSKVQSSVVVQRLQPKALHLCVWNQKRHPSSYTIDSRIDRVFFLCELIHAKNAHILYIYINICNWLLLLLPLWGSTHIHYHSPWTNNPCFTTTKSSLCNVLVVGLLVLVNICICIWSSSSAMLNVRTDGRRTADHIGRLGFFFYIFKKLRVAIKCIRWAKFINSKRHGIDMFIKRFGLIIWDWTYFSFDVWTFVK